MDEGRWKNSERLEGSLMLCEGGWKNRLVLWGEKVEKRWVDLWLRKTFGLSKYTCK